MTPAELDRLAHHVNLDRPDWQLTSLRTWIAANLAGRPYLDALHAFLDCAADPATKTPARVLEAGPWWRPRASESVAYYGPQATQCRRCGEWPSPGEEHTCRRKASREKAAETIAAMKAAADAPGRYVPSEMEGAA